MRTRVFLASTEPLSDETVFNRLYAMATEVRKKKIDRYRFLRDRMQSLAAEGLLLFARKEAGLPASAFAYAYGKNGKPYFADAPELCFNLSHSGNFVMLAVSDAPIGCDIERIRTADDRVARHIMTPEEFAAFCACEESERDAHFTGLWTAKESYLKACGEGILTDPAAIFIEAGPVPRIFRSGERMPFALRTGAIPGYCYAVCRAGELPAFETETVSLFDLFADDDSLS